MKFELMPQDWYKRRDKVKEDSYITQLSVRGFRKIENSNCLMQVTYEDGTQIELGSIVQHNVGADRWTVHGLNEHGVSVLARLVE